jgi:2-oxoglutarate ferredoxin oxidoreductase subunit gamma
MEKCVLIGGFGGQGILFMGKIIAQAAMLSGREVTWFPSYGAEIRCGTANCTVIVSDESIGSPVVGRADVIIVFNEASLIKYSTRIAEGGLILYDSSLMRTGAVDADDQRDMRGIDASAQAMAMGSARAANMVMLGAAAALTDIIDERFLLDAIEENISGLQRRDVAVNKKAFIKGFALYENSQGI